MPILLISALLLAGLGYWEYMRLKAGLPLLPSYDEISGAPRTPEQIAKTDTPLLEKEVLDLYYNGRDGQAMHRAAMELEKYGFFDSALLLHKRADQLLASLPSVTSPSGLSSPPPMTPDDNPTLRNLLAEVAKVNESYSVLDRQVQPLTNLTPKFLQSWTTIRDDWRSFFSYIERLNSVQQIPLIPSISEELIVYRKKLAVQQKAFETELGIFSPIRGPVTTAPFQAGSIVRARS